MKVSNAPPAHASPGFLNQLRNYVQLMRLDKPIGIWLLLWPTLWALWLASEGHPDPGIFVVFVLGVIIMRSAGCVLNDFVDRKIDPYVERTRWRPIASGAVAPMEALTLFLALGLIAIGLAAMLNRPAQILAVIGAALTILYPFIKRFLSIPQFVLGMAFGWAVPMAFAAQTGQTQQLAWLVFGTALVWAVIYDTFYAMADREDDLKIGVRSTAILFGDADLFVIGGLQILMLAALIFIGDMAELGGQSERCHRAVGREAGRSRAHVVVAVGAFARMLTDGATGAAETSKRIYSFPTVDALMEKIRSLIEPGDTVLLKASRVMALERIVPAIERVGLLVTDIEILRLHYAETLRRWRRRFLANWDRAAEIEGERFCRMWEFYLAGSEVAFRYENLMVFQIQLAKNLKAVPLTREYIHAAEGRLRALDDAIAEAPRLAGE